MRAPGDLSEREAQPEGDIMVTLKDMLDSGVHFGHQTQRWNPKMKPYVFGDRGGIHIIDLQKTLEKTKQALAAVEEKAAQGEKIIFVGTKKQAVEAVQEAAQKCGGFYINKRWLGGTLTNFVTIKQSIDRLKKIDQMRDKGELGYFSKKERSQIEKEYAKLNDFLEGIREMKEPPGMIFIVDVTKEHIAVKEAKNMDMTVFGICDTNSDPEPIQYPIPGNDDAIRSIKLFCELVAQAYNAGAKKWEEKRRAQTDKESDLVAEVKPRARKKEDSAPSGPSVIRANKGRKLVAAGTADEIEIMQEVEATVSDSQGPEKVVVADTAPKGENPDKSAQPAKAQEEGELK